MNRIFRWQSIAFAGVSLIISSCGALDVSDPTVIEEEDVANPTGASLLRNDALRRYYDVVDDNAAWTGMLADEFAMYGSENSIDRRAVLSEMTELILPPVLPIFFGWSAILTRGGLYGMWQHVRSAATLALQANGNGPSESQTSALLFAVRGYATIALAEGFCPGFPLNDIVDFKPIYSSPHTTEQAFARALADLDTAAAGVTDSLSILNFARVGRGRALLGLGRFADAAAATAQVPTSFVRNAEYDAANPGFGGQGNDLANHSFFTQRRVGDLEGTNGLNFVSAQDQRAAVLLSFNSPTLGTRYGMAKYMDRPGEPIVVASGIEARLIEAEAALKTNNPNWLLILNDLRSNQTSPALQPLADPGSDQARVSLLFRERAMWLFGTGHRLGDMRRLMAHYGRDSENVFPTGAYRAGGAYGRATSIFFPAVVESSHNPSITGCTDR